MVLAINIYEVYTNSCLKGLVSLSFNSPSPFFFRLLLTLYLAHTDILNILDYEASSLLILSLLD